MTNSEFLFLKNNNDTKEIFVTTDVYFKNIYTVAMVFLINRKSVRVGSKLFLIQVYSSFRHSFQNRINPFPQCAAYLFKGMKSNHSLKALQTLKPCVYLNLSQVNIFLFMSELLFAHLSFLNGSFRECKI